jgi:GrpB-like predicted nucleotidyltransferase (UPF0157 family)
VAGGALIASPREPCDHGQMRPEDRVASTHPPARPGAGEGPIEIIEYDPSWPARYDAEGERLAPLLPGVRIHHIASGAVPGLAGKAVIDMIALVDVRDSLRANRKLAADYVALKRALPAHFREDHEGYTKAKSKFINDADSQAGASAQPACRPDTEGGRRLARRWPVTRPP